VLDTRSTVRVLDLVDTLERQPARGVKAIVSLLAQNRRARPRASYNRTNG
jgi:hypothetical protein